MLALLKFGRDALSGREAAAPTELTLADGSQILLHGRDYNLKTVLSEPNNETFELVVSEIRQIRDMALEDGSRLVVLLQPAKEEIYRESPDAPRADATAALRGRLEKMDIEYIDVSFHGFNHVNISF